MMKPPRLTKPRGRAIALAASILIQGCFSLSSRAQEAEPSPLAEAMTVTVQPGGRQIFAGLGTSLGNWGGDYQKLTVAERDRLSGLLWRGLKMKSLRLWVNLNEYAPTPNDRLSGDFRRRYIDSGIIADAVRNGVVDLVLAPDNIPPFLKDKRPGGPQDFALRSDATVAYARLIAEFIGQIHAETGVLINVTGIQNEPNGLDRIDPDQMVAVVKALREELDARELKMIRIIAPESANVDSTYFDKVDKLRADPAAWGALAGLASHSYGMAATPEAARRVEAPGGGNLKQYWMTEASDNGPEEPGDATRAASLACRFLNDTNQRTTHWIHFLGFEVPDPNDNATRIIAYTPGPLRLTIFQKYYYYQQLGATFDVGAIGRESTSSSAGGMVWTYGKKPHLTASATRNPDGGWGIGLCNFTSPRFTDDPNEPNSSSNGAKARSITVTVQVVELADSGEVAFEVHRSGRHLSNATEGALVARDGLMTMTVGPLELVTLRSAGSRQRGQ